MIRKQLADVLRAAAKSAGEISFSLDVSPRPEYGDYASNLPMVIAARDKKDPMMIAAEISEALKSHEVFAKVETVKPGFINMTLRDSYLLKSPSLDSKVSLPIWRDKKVIVEFTDPNPFKEFHIGHLYSNIVGESLSRIFQEAGAIVKRANYQGDVGLHVAKAIWGMQKSLEASGKRLSQLASRSLTERAKFLGAAYAVGAKAYDTDASAKEEITALNGKIYAGDPSITDWYETGRAWSLEYFEAIYKRLGTKFDFYYFEREVGAVGLALVRKYLEGGVFEESQGAVTFPGEKYGLHRRVFINSLGLPTYEAKELGLAPAKYKDFPYDLSLIITGNEIIDYFKVLLAALHEIDPGLRAKTVHIPHGMVRLSEGKMSSRTGDVVRAEDLLDELKTLVLLRMESLGSGVSDKDRVAEEVALGAIKYSLLRIGIGKDIIFDSSTSLALEGESGPYVQYTYARLRSITRKHNGEISPVSPDFLEKDEHSLVLKLLQWPEAVEDAAENYAPSIIAAYVYDLAKLANEFYHLRPVLNESDNTKKNFRLSLVQETASVLKRGLFLLGISAPEEM